MTTTDYKKEVLAFFDGYIYPYLVGDLEKLQSIQANADGTGGCAIPEALTAFAACDLFGFLIDPQTPGVLKMRMMPFLKSGSLFPELGKVQDTEGYLDALRDDVRSMLVHRFGLSKFQIGKLDDKQLIVNQNGYLVFNIKHFTALVINAIHLLRESIEKETFTAAASETFADFIQRFYNQLQLLKAHESAHFEKFSAYTAPSSTTTTQTTSSLG